MGPKEALELWPGIAMTARTLAGLFATQQILYLANRSPRAPKVLDRDIQGKIRGIVTATVSATDIDQLRNAQIAGMAAPELCHRLHTYFCGDEPELRFGGADNQFAAAANRSFKAFLRALTSALRKPEEVSAPATQE